MGTNEFQTEYIEYLQKYNTELLNQFNQMKESYKNRILSKDFNKDYLISTLEDVQNIFTVVTQEIDLFFDKITAAMGFFKNVLLRKSEMIQLMDRIAKTLNSSDNFNELLPNDDQFPGTALIKKAGTAKVSPMINGHVISTEPRIYLSRVPGVLTSGRRSETHQLSPIIEASPDTSSDPSNMRCHSLKEIKIPLERLNLNKMSYNFMSEESPKTRFKGPKLWKKSLSSNKHQSDSQGSFFSENNENLNKKLAIGEELPHRPESIDPLEGPSWLYKEDSEIDSSSSRFIDYKRRKHRFATVFDKNESYFVEKKQRNSSKQDANEFYENHNKANDEEEDFEEIRERLSETSDFIYTSFSCEVGENYSPFEKRHHNSGRKRTEKISEEKVTEKIDRELKKALRDKNREVKSISKTPIYSDFSGEGENEVEFSQSMKNRKSHGRMSPELSFEKTQRRSEKVCCLSCVEEEKKLPKRSKTESLGEKKKLKKSKSKSKSRSPAIVLQENEGRMKRKAAPTRLVEPPLRTKLRRA